MIYPTCKGNSSDDHFLILVVVVVLAKFKRRS